MKVQLKALLLYRETSSASADHGFCLAMYPLESCGYITVGEQVIEVDVPDDFDPRQQQIEILEKEKTRISAEFTKRCCEIQTHINNLYALDLT